MSNPLASLFEANFRFDSGVHAAEEVIRDVECVEKHLSIGVSRGEAMPILAERIRVVAARTCRAGVAVHNSDASPSPILASVDGRVFVLVETGKTYEIGTVELKEGSNIVTVYIIPLIVPFPNEKVDYHVTVYVYPK